jgi:hypothetical protein
MIVNPSDEFCIGRMVTNIGLTKIAATDDLRTARIRVKELIKAWPGDYVVFQKSDGSVVAKASSLGGTKTTPRVRLG